MSTVHYQHKHHSSLVTLEQFNEGISELKQENKSLRKDMDHRFEMVDKSIELKILHSTNKLLFSMFSLISGVLAVMVKGFHWI